MWQIDNRTPFAAAGTWVRDRQGREVWIVAVRATFEVDGHGEVALAAHQPAVLRGPLHRGEPGRSSLLGESDLILTKRTTDIVVEGRARAPEGRPVDRMIVGVRVGPVVKALQVSGDRRWRLGRPGPPDQFVDMPIVYERAFGGVDVQAPLDANWEMRNPVGTGFALERDHLDATPPPNVEYPDERIRSWRDRPRPAGFGAIESHWLARARYAGTYDDEWTASRLPLPPDDFDERFFQCVPEDQQAPTFLQGGEPVLLRGLLHAGDLAFHLPRCSPTFETRFFSGPPQRHAASLYSVVLEPPIVSLVFHSALPCHARGDALERTVVACDWGALHRHLDAGVRRSAA